MAYLEDMRRVFHPAEELSADYEVRLIDRSFVTVSGHKGLSVVSLSEIVVKIRRGRIRLYGKELRLVEAGPSELYVRGEIDGVEYLI